MDKASEAGDVSVKKPKVLQRAATHAPMAYAAPVEQAPGATTNAETAADTQSAIEAPATFRAVLARMLAGMVCTLR